MKKKVTRWVLRIISFILIAAAIILTIPQVKQAQQQDCYFSENVTIAGIPVSGLDLNAAQRRLEAVYQSPVTVNLDQTFIHLFPDELSIHFDYEKMLNEAAAACKDLTFWQRFRNILWKNPISGFKSVELYDSINDEKIRSYIKDQIVPRYTVSPTNAQSIPGSTEFIPGFPGRLINQEKLFTELKRAFTSPSKREVIAEFTEVPGSSPDFPLIGDKLREIIRGSGFDGLTAIYLNELSGEGVDNFALQNNTEIDPNIAFTAASTMKIPIMVSTFWRESLPLPDIISGWLNYMLILSENSPADRLMENIDPVRGPLIVTEDMQLLGLENTFIAGYFFLGSPLLNFYQTPANSRNDINLDPDMYNQTTPQEIGKLLSDIYYCAETRSGLLVEKSGGSITAEECQMMIDILSRNQIGALIEAGVPEGTKIAHKHGWSEEQDGLLHTVSDVAIVYGPEKDFVLTIFVYSSNQLLFEDANYLIAKLTQTTFNGLNSNHQIPWLFDN